MNIIVAIMLIFALIGFIDKMFHLKWGLSESFDKGLMTMGTMAISIVGICSVGVTFIQNHIQWFTSLSSHLPVDATLIVSMILAPDMGGFSITQQLTENAQLIILNGVILTSLLGQTISFQFPVFLSVIDQNEHPTLMKGFIIGIIIVPVGLLIAGLMLKMSISLFLSQFIPIFIICLLIVGGLIIFPKYLIKIFTAFANIIQLLTYILFLMTVIGLFIPSLAYAPLSAVQDSITIVFRSCIIVSGSLVLSEIILKYFRPMILKMAKYLDINEVSMMGLILSCATSLAIFPLFSRMDRKGKMLNAAFSVSGAYFLGGQLGYISGITSSYAVTIYVICKLICGLLSLFVMSKIYRKVAD